MSLPDEVRLMPALLNGLEERTAGKLLDAVMHYSHSNPTDSIRYPARNVKPKVWMAGEWSHLYARKLRDSKAVLVYWRDGVAWLYRGRPELVTDLLGPGAVTMWDELRMTVPVYSRFDY